MNIPGLFRLVRLLLAGGVIALSACARSAGPIFEPLSAPVQWPPPPDVARIAYVGQLATSDDLKPAVTGVQAFGQAVFGKADAHAMLTPFAVCTDGASRMFVADSNAQVVHVFNVETRQYEQWKPPAPLPGRISDQPQFAQPVGIAWDPAGRLIVADSVAGALFVFDTNGKFIGEMGAAQLERPCGIAINPVSRRILVADAKAHQIVILDADGRFVSRVGRRGTELGEFNYPTYVALDSQGRLYVSDSLNFRVQLFAPEGNTYKPIRTIGRQGDVVGYFAQPKGIAVDGEDHLYVIDSQFEIVEVFDDQGHVLMEFGEEGHGPGQFWLPTCLFIDRNNRIWVADSYNKRVQVFDYKSQPKSPETQP